MSERRGRQRRRATPRGRRREPRHLTGRQLLVVVSVAIAPAVVLGWEIGRALLGGPPAQIPLLLIGLALAMLMWGVWAFSLWWRSPGE